MHGQQGLWIYSFKQGALSPLGHDLRLSLTQFDLARTSNGWCFTAVLDALVVDGCITPGDRGLWPQTERVTPMNPGDAAKVLRTLREEILHARRFPSVAYRARAFSGEPLSQTELDETTVSIVAPGGSLRVTLVGELELHGATHAVKLEGELDWRDAVPAKDAVRVNSASNHDPTPELALWLSVRGALTPSRWGIAPYRALLGALRLEDRVEVVAVLRVPA